MLGHVAPTPWVATAADQLLAGKSIKTAVAEAAGKAAVAWREAAQPERLQSAAGAGGGETRAAGGRGAEGMNRWKRAGLTQQSDEPLR